MAQMSTTGKEIVIRGAAVITMDPQRQVFDPGYVHIKGDRIAAVGPLSSAGDDGSAGPAGAQIMEAQGMIALPGLVDTHGHAGHGLTKSVAEHLDDGWVPLVESIYYQYSTDDFWYAEAMLSGLERLKYGTTTGYNLLGASPRADDPRYAERHMAGHGRIGGRNILGIGPPNPPWPRKCARWSADGSRLEAEYDLDLRRSLEVTEEVVRAYAQDPAVNRLLVQVGPSRVGDQPGMDLATNRWLHDQLKRIAAAAGVIINSHSYGGNIQYAYDYLDVLGPGVMLAHCTGLSAREIDIMGETGTRVSHGPSTRAYQRARCPMIQLLKSGALVTISTDGSGPDRTFDLFKEMRTAMILQRSHFHDSSLLPPGQVLAMVTIDAARGLGLDHLIGSLETGKKADLILVRGDQPHMYPAVQPVQRIVYAAAGQDVDTVIVDGEVIMRHRKVQTIDEAEVLDMAQHEALAAFRRAGIEHEMLVPPGLWGGRV